ncbi:MAG: response regulator [Bacteroidota bacterium]
MIQVLIVDDHQVLADGIKALVGQAEDVQIQHHAMTGKEAMNILADYPEIQLILLDINLPDTDEASCIFCLQFAEKAFAVRDNRRIADE